jgi:hypothetical protein
MWRPAQLRPQKSRKTRAGRHITGYATEWRNREEIHDILAQFREENTERDDEIIVCIHCDASPPSLAMAVKQGWKDIQYDDGQDWNYLGICPDCVKDETNYDRRLESTGRKMSRAQQVEEDGPPKGNVKDQKTLF